MDKKTQNSAIGYQVIIGLTIFGQEAEGYSY